MPCFSLNLFSSRSCTGLFTYPENSFWSLRISCGTRSRIEGSDVPCSSWAALRSRMLRRNGHLLLTHSPYPAVSSPPVKNRPVFAKFLVATAPPEMNAIQVSGFVRTSMIVFVAGSLPAAFFDCAPRTTRAHRGDSAAGWDEGPADAVACRNAVPELGRDERRDSS
jgi:hypothetical protein